MKKSDKKIIYWLFALLLCIILSITFTSTDEPNNTIPNTIPADNIKILRK